MPAADVAPASLLDGLLGHRSQRDLGASAERVARSLLRGAPSLGGRPVVFLAHPGPAYVELLLGIMKGGGMAVPLSPLHTAPELAHVIENAQPALIIATAELADRLAGTAGGREVATAESLAATGGLAQGTASAQPGHAPLPAPAPDAPAIMLYTSGTTGRPKGVVLSHQAVLATVSALAQAWAWRQDDRLLHVLPLHHTHGVIVALLGALFAGAQVDFAAFDAPSIWDRFKDATVFMAVPTMYAKLMESFRAAPPEQRQRWSAGARGLRLCTSGSAALPAALLREFQQATGQVILERYGMTEIGMALSNPYHPDEGPRVAGAVGRPLPGVCVDIVTDDERAAAVDEPGELRVTTPQMFLGYYGDPGATTASFDEAGRFRTGDTGVRDGAGVIRLLGRTSVDVLKSAGYKISALEIEAVLREHPGVAEVAVIGVPDATWGECVTACVVGRAGHAPNLESLKEFSRAYLAPYKLPRALRLLDSLPRNPMGKVQKKELLAAMAPATESAAPSVKAPAR